MQTSVKTVVEGLKMADELVFRICREKDCCIKITDGEEEEIYENVILEALGPGMVAFKRRLPGMIDEDYGEWSYRYGGYQVIISPTMRIDISSKSSILSY